jgi:hypothetical protein
MATLLLQRISITVGVVSALIAAITGGILLRREGVSTDQGNQFAERPSPDISPSL